MEDQEESSIGLVQPQKAGEGSGEEKGAGSSSEENMGRWN
jgi:hypothetical protein